MFYIPLVTVCLYMGWAYDITNMDLSKSALLERIGLHCITKAAVLVLEHVLLAG